MPISRRAAICVLCAANVAMASAYASDATDQAARIAAVEQGLRPAAILDGQPVPTRRLTDAMAALHVQGVSIAVIHQGRIAWAKGYGVVDQGGAKITPQTMFQAGSISKSVTTVAALQLVDAHRLTLDGDVNDALRAWHVPANAWTALHPVTLRELLSHTAGVNVHGFEGYAAGTPVPTTLQVLDGATPANSPAIRVVAEPGKAWSYSGGGFTIAQQLIVDTTQTPFPKWMQQHVLSPAGMQQSTFEQPLPAQWRGKAATPHLETGDAVKGGPHLYPEMAAAGLWTTPSDLARLLIQVQQALSGKSRTLLEPATARVMLDPVKPGHSMGFDLGGSGKDGYFAKGGDTTGFAGQMVAYANRGDGVVILTNGANGNVLADDLIRSVAAAYDWPDFRSHSRKAIDVDKTMWPRLVGTYTYGNARTFSIRIENDHLAIVSSPTSTERLYAQSAAQWFTLSDDATYVFDNASGSAAVSGRIEVGGDALPFHRVSTKP